jgi:hypothetical protein
VRRPDIRVKILENVYGMLHKFRIIYGVEVWGLGGVRRETDEIHKKFYKIILCYNWQIIN